MTNATTENFWKVWSAPLAPAPAVYYRLYHDTDGNPICYTMEDLPGLYIEVDKETYHIGSHRVKVIDGKLIHVPLLNTIKKLKPSSSTGTPCHPENVCVIVPDSCQHQKWSCND